MKHFSFTPPPSENQLSIYQWYRFSIYFLCSICLIFLFLSIRDMYTFFGTSSRSDYSQDQELQELQQACNAQENRLAEIKHQNSSLKHPVTLLQILAITVPADLRLTRITFDTQNLVTLEGEAQRATSCITFAKQLSMHEHIKGVHSLNSTIHPAQKESFVFTIIIEYPKNANTVQGEIA
jgi:hypothetical protein